MQLVRIVTTIILAAFAGDRLGPDQRGSAGLDALVHRARQAVDGSPAHRKRPARRHGLRRSWPTSGSNSTRIRSGTAIRGTQPIRRRWRPCRRSAGLLFEGKNAEATKLAGDKMMGRPQGVQSYQSLGDLYIPTPGGRDRRRLPQEPRPRHRDRPHDLDGRWRPLHPRGLRLRPRQCDRHSHHRRQARRHHLHRDAHPPAGRQLRQRRQRRDRPSRPDQTRGTVRRMRTSA